MEKQPKTVKEGNCILRISVIGLFTSDLGDQAQVFILIYSNSYFSLSNKEFLSLTARTGMV